MATLVHEPSRFAAACDRVRAEGKRLALVPTMGALHEGHLSLFERARELGADVVAATIFVNPLQFDSSADLDGYPRTLDRDHEACRAAGVDLVFAPSPASMYPAGFATSVQVGTLTARLEGEHRPGHFEGVTTVVCKLFCLAGPCVAVFGRKDYQQWRTIERMAADLGLPIDVQSGPTVREPDGLALSSRNARLSPTERDRALGIVSGLRAAALAYDDGERDSATLLRLASAPVESSFDRVDYVALSNPMSLEPVDGRLEGAALLCVAAHLGETRLIDNFVLGHDPLAALRPT